MESETGGITLSQITEETEYHENGIGHLLSMSIQNILHTLPQLTAYNSL